MANKHHISDELLAAYLDGNTNAEETKQVLQALKDDPQLQEILDIATSIDEDLSHSSIGNVSFRKPLPPLQIAAEGGRNLCDVQCEAYVLEKRGLGCKVEELLEIAKKNRWIQRAGTPLNCIGNLIEYNGLKVSRIYEASIQDIMEALEKGDDVIVAVDSDKLYPERPDEEDATNHAVVVTEIDVEKGVVTIFDPGNIEEEAILLPLFKSAWRESQYYLVEIIG